MNKLPKETRVQILNMLVEGCSMRAISRMVGVSINTVTKLLVEAGEACAVYHSRTVQDVKSERVQCDEIWSFVAAKEKNVPGMKRPVAGAGDVWTWTALDADSKLIIAYQVGNRDADCALEFMHNVQYRLANRVQLTTDGHRAYLYAVRKAFGTEVDFAQLVKLYGEAPEGQRRYSPPVCTGAKKKPITGNPDLKDVSTSFVERQNLTMRMSMRRFTRLTNAFSKKLDNHIHTLSLYFVFYNFCRVHKTLGATPAMAAGLSDRVHDLGWIVDLIDARAAPPKKRGPYKKRSKQPAN